MDQAAIPPTSLGDSADTGRFREFVSAAEEIKDKYVKPRIAWYQTHTTGPRLWFRWAGGMMIVLSSALPALALAKFDGKDYVRSAMSVLIAMLTGFSSFFHWERIWHGNSNAQMPIEQHCAKWELEIKNAELMLPAQEKITHVYKATSDLLANVAGVTSAETEGFFSALAFPQGEKSTSAK
jgi:hypothetical protein